MYYGNMWFFKVIPSLNETFHCNKFNMIKTVAQLQEIISYLFRGLRMFSPARLTTASHSGKGDLEISFYLRYREIERLPRLRSYN